jgi:hypothetical protein
MSVLAPPGMAAPVRVVRRVVDLFVWPVGVVAVVMAGRVQPVAFRCPEVVMAVLVRLGLAAQVRVVRRVVNSLVPLLNPVAVVVARVLPRLSASWRWR